MKKEYYNIIQPFILPILIGALFITTIIIFKPSFWILLPIILLIILWFNRTEDLKTIIKNLFQTTIFLLVIHYLYFFTGTKGILITIGVTILITLILLYRRRKLYMKTIRDIEILIWGKTNDRRKK